jgi:O-antigen/teichoic acid export membrane protein
MIGFISVIITLQYSTALLQAKESEEYNALLALCWLICIAISSLVAFSTSIAFFFGVISTKLWFFIYLLPLGALVGGAIQIAQSVQLRHQSFYIMSASRVVQASSLVGFAFAFARSGIGSPGLILSDVISKIFSIVTWLRMNACNSTPGKFHLVSGKVLWRTAFSFRDCPFVTSVGGIINTAGASATGALMYAAFGASDAGQFGLVERSLTLPVGIIANTLSQIFTSKLSNDLRLAKIEILPYFRRFVGTCFLFALIPSMLLFFLSTFLFESFFGANWRIAGEYAQILCPLLLIQFATAPLHMSLLLLGKRSTQFLWELSRLLLMIVGWSTIYQGGFSSHIAVSFHVGAHIAMNLAFLFVVDRSIQFVDRSNAIASATNS